MEQQVEQIYDHYSYPPTIRDHLEEFLRDKIKDEQKKYAAEQDGLRREKDKLERQRKKLLEAHYNDAIPLEFLKSEQQKITRQLTAIDQEVKAYETAFTSVSERLNEALDILEDCGKTYRLADDHIKRIMNQSIFSKLWVGQDGTGAAEFAPPFTTLMKPIEDSELVNFLRVESNEKVRGDKTPSDFLLAISNFFQKFFGQSLNNDFLVEISGIEPLTSYNIVTVKGTAASRVFCRLKAEAVE